MKVLASSLSILPGPASPHYNFLNSLVIIPSLLSHRPNKPLLSLSSQRVSALTPMDSVQSSSKKELPAGLDAVMEEEYASQSVLLKEFTNISTIDKAWTFKSSVGSQAMFSVSHPNLLANKRRKNILSSQISKGTDGSVSFQWAPFPIEITGASTMFPSPSGSKLLVVRNSEDESPTQFEIWGPSQLEKEVRVPQSVHGSVYCDGWFEGISWNSDESLIAYVAEEPAPSKPTFGDLGYKKGGSTDKDSSSWKGEGDWEEDWGETYAGKRQPALFVVNVNSGEVHAVGGIGRSLSVGQVVWAPLNEGMHQYLVFVGWPSDSRKLGIKYCYNRACALYAVRAPTYKSEAKLLQPGGDATDDVTAFNLTRGISSAFFPRFSPDGKFLVFLSAKTSIDTWAHCATNSLHRFEWPTDDKFTSVKLVEVVPVVMCPKDGCFPGLYSLSMLSNPWLSDGYTLILPSIWCSMQVILSINVLSGNVSRITPHNSNYSWNLLTLDGNNVIAVSSSPVNVPELKYGSCAGEASSGATWSWLDVSSPIFKCPDQVTSLLSALQFSIMKIPLKCVPENLPEGAKKPIEAIFVSSNSKSHDVCQPLIVMLHGGPHSVSPSSYSRSMAFLASTGYSLLIVNYR
ncbi:Acylaminoacyl-peptidase [Heracleum sosnowskyi]|uniref:Acylaminoacyl-peptidase n=1 Tax=Heracleum sosnowskyi TaxID=360622 RepID=A0AAD8I6A5_9APIA|nr:Acylaminoacyl-peptidase [Heracleum sosnowskyi]